MTGAISNVTGLNMTNYATLYNDPYFQQAFNSPNINAQQSIMNQATMAQPTATATQPTVAPQASLPFKGASSEIAEEGEKKKSNGWKWVLGIAATAGLAFCGYKCYNKGAGEGLSKIFDGAKQYLSGASKTVKGLAKASDKADDVFTIAKNGDDILCTVPGRTNVLKGSNLTDDAIKKLGGSTELPSLLDKGTEIMKYEAKLSDGSVITVMGDKVRSIVNPSGAKVSLDKLSEAGNKEISDIIAAVRGKDETVLNGLQNVIGRRTDGGVTRKFVAQATDAAKNGVRSASTKKFLVDSTAVKAYRQQYPQLSEAIDEFGKDVTSKFRVFTADRETNIGTFKIIGDKIAGIQTPAGQYYAVDSDNYKALLFDNKDIFDGVLSDPKKFTNIIYQAA